MVSSAYCKKMTPPGQMSEQRPLIDPASAALASILVRDINYLVKKERRPRITLPQPFTSNKEISNHIIQFDSNTTT
jgi:hypothetical protein